MLFTPAGLTEILRAFYGQTSVVIPRADEAVAQFGIVPDEADKQHLIIFWEELPSDGDGLKRKEPILPFNQ